MKGSLIVCLVVLMQSGCTTLMFQSREQAVREQAEIDNLKAAVVRLEAQVEGFQTAQEDLLRQIAQAENLAERENAALKERLVALQRELAAGAAARKALKDELVRELSKKMADLMASQAAVRATETGRWHAVEPGQTLSEIARAYGVTVQAIVRANDELRTENTIIKVGQRLFIPE